MGMSMGLSGQGPAHQRAVSEINVTPLVDIMLVLLIIFMVTAPLMSQGVDIELPKANSKPMASDKEPLIVNVKADGAVFLESKAVTLEELKEKVGAIRQAKPDLVVYVRGDKSAGYGSVMAVMGELQMAGVERVGLVSEPK